VANHVVPDAVDDLERGGWIDESRGADRDSGGAGEEEFDGVAGAEDASMARMGVFTAWAAS
jgi:hypothetical protein